MKIYLAARFTRIDEMRGYADELKEDGHEITASWVYGGEEGLTFSDIAALDVRDVLRADTIVKFSEPYGSANPGGGRHSEWGVAIASGKQLYLVGPKEQVFDWYPDVIDFPMFKHLRNHLRGKNAVQ
jgi:nucleoside 2-deoxyribosyltransferase